MAPSTKSSRSYIMTDGQLASVSCQAPIWGTRLIFFFFNLPLGFVDVGSPLWREGGSVVYSWCWDSPAQSISGPSPTELKAIFYCLKFETPLAWRVRLLSLSPPPPRTGWPSYGVGVLLAADSQSTSSSGYRASFWDPWPDVILLFFLRLTIAFFFFQRRLLWRENRSVVYSAITH
jgi:hypothetical protein